MKVYELKNFSSEENKTYSASSLNIKVSIIIPIYNVEKYLIQCLDSVVNQTLKEIEILCINDGSTDNSLRILEEYAKKDKRIRVINKKNAGVGAARNTGLEYAKGEYIGFVDSDDWVDITMFEKLYQNSKYHNSDIVMCPMSIVYENDEELGYYRYSNILSYYDLDCFNDEFDDCVFDYKQTKDFILRIAVNAYNKIYRTEFIKEIDAKFPEGMIFEDNPFFYHTYLNAKNLSLVKDFLYYHRVNRMGSLISTGDQRFFDMIKIQNLIIKNFTSIPNFEDYEIDLLNNKIKTIIDRYFQVSDIHRQEFFELIKKDFEKMNLKTDKIENLKSHINKNYLNIINSNSHKEFELNEEKEKLLNRINELTNHNKQLLENSNKQKLRLNALEKQLNGIEISDNNAVDIKNRNSYVSILFNRNNQGIKDAIINIRGYRAIKKNNLFDANFYLRNNTDVRLSGMDPIVHYMYHGFKEGRNPNPSFDGDLYLEKHRDVKNSKLNPLVHYSLYGIKEARVFMKPKISIIIPVYNVENYIRDALESIVGQTIGLECLEVVMVDDCSTDGSGDIIDEYASKYENFIAIHLTKNSGAAGKPRNIGIEKSNAEYLMFLDADDYYSVDACEMLYNKIVAEDVDIVFGSYIYVFEDRMQKIHSPFGDIDEIKVKIIDDEPKLFKIPHPSIWAKILKKKFIKDNNISFPEGITGQDLVFVIHAFLKANGIIFLNNYIVCNYNRIRDSSGDKGISRVYSKKNLMGMVKAYNETFAILKDNGKEKYFPLIFDGHLQFWINNFILSDLNSCDKRELLEGISALFNEYKKYDVNPKKHLITLFNDISEKRYDEAIVQSEILCEFIKNENKNQLRLNALEKQLNGIEISDNNAVDIKNRNSYVSILFNRNNQGIKDAIINIRGYRAIKKNNLFDANFYLRNNTDVRLSGMDPIVHYMYHGFKEGRNPNPSFDGDLYLEKHRDVKNSKLNPLVHYSLYGIKEARKIQKKS